MSQLQKTSRVHGGALAFAWARAQTTDQKWRAALDKLGEDLMKGLLDTGVGEVVGMVASLVPGLQLAVDTLGEFAKRAFRESREEVRLRDQAARDTPIGAMAGDEELKLSADVALLVREISTRGLPAIVVIEDLHDMGQDLAEFLKLVSLPQAGHPVFVLGTMWPEGAHKIEGQLAGLGGRVEILSMPDLEVDARCQLVLELAPKTEAGVALDVAEHFSNPVVLRLQLALWADRIRLGGGRLEISGPELDAISPTVKAVFQRVWEALEPRIKDSLIFSVACLPEAKDGESASFIAEVCAEAFSRINPELRAVWQNLSASPDYVLAIRDAEADAQWLQRSGAAFVFREPVLDGVARANVPDIGPPLQELVAAVVEVLESRIEAQRDEWTSRNFGLSLTSANALLANWLVSLSPDRRTTACLVARLAVVRDLRSRGKRDKVMQLLSGGPWTLGSGSRGEDDVRWRIEVATTLALWEDEKASDVASEALTVARAQLGSNHPLTWLARNIIVHANPPDGALEMARAMVVDAVGVAGADKARLAIVRAAYADELHFAGQCREAAEEFRRVIQLNLEDGGPWERMAANVGYVCALAICLDELGDEAEARQFVTRAQTHWLGSTDEERANDNGWNMQSLQSISVQFDAVTPELVETVGRAIREPGSGLGSLHGAENVDGMLLYARMLLMTEQHRAAIEEVDLILRYCPEGDEAWEATRADALQIRADAEMAV